ncbi:protein phosphatase 1B-like [Amphibalanus amphitrite]|uniref:protein phosphatase 1B-like n=1 Tax=Amphibalanus amphitrite TaxID=1232801 RepID=UPI001C9114DE|nr:protein phosphatase 1B-like [Amphibalanus amphitrite]XP_043195084.1 protein phosphatase 1B-like [Amphibalanus amphitrite]XP_043195085.1 protein phosphatase 1B-like [Amphibalanus amphitrite]XP_043195087.1 protein phosphatase 1B-like [Amphibalanus amphitrite]XP_043236411.1 protein phosphatase 1B-like [Amphibalanus amphitrite]XP_043236412.1 protein phosphatase 1B-like [Amphibalanus amphitrite]XP_043236413.1 protein phosphatase 1B-like [Amphibalanus amphitrite]XP_043236414.1 protein phosphata
MGAFLDKPNTEKHTETGSGNGLQYALASEQGWRTEMEDAHCAVSGVSEQLRDWSFFAVFDGHAGSKVSAFCSQTLLSHILQSEQMSPETLRQLAGDETALAESVRSGLVSGFLRLDERMRSEPDVETDKSGSTAVCALVSPTHVFVANCGDSRALMCRRGEIALSTTDHKPINPGEKERIEKAGGNVMIQRVNGSLAVSRALGDYDYKNVSGKGQCEQLVSPEPEVYVEKRQADDEFLVLACDGVWDVFDNTDLCQFVRSRLRVTDKLDEVVNQILDTCFYKGSKDNMSTVVIVFPGAPKVDPAAAAREEAMKQSVAKHVEEYLRAVEPVPPRPADEDEKDAHDEEDDGPRVSMPELMTFLDSKKIADLPDGGGLASMRKYVEDVVSIVTKKQSGAGPQ